MEMREYRELVIGELAAKDEDPATPHEPKADALPEHTQYRDEGCDLSPSCLRCPLPQCRYDDPTWLRREAKVKRDQQIINAYKDQDLGPTELAHRFDLSRRTIHRIFKEHGGLDKDLNSNGAGRTNG